MVSTEYMRGWLAAFYDGEGTVHFSIRHNVKHKGKYGHGNTCLRVVKVNNTDRLLIDRCCEYLTALGIEFTVSDVRPRLSHHKFQWCVSIGKGDSLVRFAREVQLLSSQKAEALATIVAWVGRKRMPEQLKIVNLERKAGDLR